MIYRNMYMQNMLSILLLLSVVEQVSAFNSLSDVVHYAHSVSENIQEADIGQKAVYSTWFGLMKENIIERLGFKRDQLAPAQTFKKLLEEVYHQRELDYPRGRFIQKILPSAGSSLVVWGELQGAFHSLVRDLQQLQQMGLINDKLKILSKTTYLIFNGNVIGISPYALETLMIVLSLMHQNPRNVIYIKGYQEDKEHWIDLNLIKKLDAHMDKESTDSLLDLLRKFFSSLPLALYLIAPDQRENDDKNLIRISYFAPESLEFQETDVPYFFDIYADAALSLLDKVYKKTSINPHVASSIYVESPNQELISSNGLALRSKSFNRTEWLTVSSPTSRYKGMYQFFNDAFVIIKTAATVAEWTISLYYQDVRKRAGFKQDPSLFLLSGKLTDKDLQSTVIQLSEKLNMINENIENIKRNCVLPVPVLQETSFYDYQMFKYKLGLDYVNQHVYLSQFSQL